MDAETYRRIFILEEKQQEFSQRLQDLHDRIQMLEVPEAAYHPRRQELQMREIAAQARELGGE